MGVKDMSIPLTLAKRIQNVPTDFKEKFTSLNSPEARVVIEGRRYGSYRIRVFPLLYTQLPVNPVNDQFRMLFQGRLLEAGMFGSRQQIRFEEAEDGTFKFYLFCENA